MYIDKLLISIGVDTSQAEKFTQITEKLSQSAEKLGTIASEIGKHLNDTISEVDESTDNVSQQSQVAETRISKLKSGLMAIQTVAIAVGQAFVSAFNDAIKGVETFYNDKDALFKISKKELAQTKEYQSALSKANNAIENIKTKIAAGLTPALTKIIKVFLDWLNANKELIANGIAKTVEALSYVIQTVKNTIRFFDKIISATIGWKSALLILGAVWAAFNAGFIISPIGAVIAAIVALMLLIDDLMVYMDGGDSLFGEYWQPLIDGAKLVYDTIKLCWNYIKAIWSGNSEEIKSTSKKLFDSCVQIFANLFNWIKSLLPTILKSILTFFGMSESEASKVVDRIGKIFGFIFDLITLPFRTGYKLICGIMDLFGIDAGDVVNAIYVVFATLFDAITYPFKLAYNFVMGLFDIWENDTTSFIDKLGLTLIAIFDFITAPLQLALSWISNIFGSVLQGIWSGIVNGISAAFSAIFDFIIYPFNQAYDFIMSLFDIWGDDTSSFLDKIIASFAVIGDFIIKPFRAAIAWINDKVLGVINSVWGKLKGVASFFGFGSSDDEDNKDGSNGKDFDDKFNPESIKNVTKTGAKINQNKTINQGDVTNNITVNSSDTALSAKQVGDTYHNQLINAHNNATSAMGA
ncbi:hypothetical protein RHO13_08540 [Orbus wheelerorum]|uniref:phage tail protein n=1 Tax=Orbus wheelerorum TaxID=3074111 RepID=UPI00370D7FC8